MDGYLKPNAKNENRELHLLTLEDCEFVPDDELKTHFMSGRKHNCPRCGATTHITGDDPYCSDCNWDSVTERIGILKAELLNMNISFSVLIVKIV